MGCRSSTSRTTHCSLLSSIGFVLLINFCLNCRCLCLSAKFFLSRRLGWRRNLCPLAKWTRIQTNKHTHLPLRQIEGLGMRPHWVLGDEQEFGKKADCENRSAGAPHRTLRWTPPRGCCRLVRHQLTDSEERKALRRVQRHVEGGAKTGGLVEG